MLLIIYQVPGGMMITGAMLQFYKLYHKWSSGSSSINLSMPWGTTPTARQVELMDGITVTDADGEVACQSRVAAREGIAKVLNSS